MSASNPLTGTTSSSVAASEVAVIAGGCFWGIEDILRAVPGVIDTDMQAQLRNADAKAFPDQKVFIDYKNSGQLTSPDDAAKRVLTYLARADFGANPVADVRDK